MIATIILLLIGSINLGVALAKHNEPKKENYNFWAQLIAFITLIVLYYYAGLFDNLK